VEEARQALPELPDARRQRFATQYGITPYDALVLCLDKVVAEWFEQAATGSANPKAVANWTLTEVLREAKSAGEGDASIPAGDGLAALKFGPAELRELVDLIEKGTISGKIAKTVFAAMVASGGSPEQIVKDQGLVQVSDTGAIEAAIQAVLAANASSVESYRGGNVKLKGFFVGQVMKATGGKANPGMVNQILDRLLA